MAGKFTKCPQCGGRKPQLMSCTECGYSYIQSKMKNKSIVNNKGCSHSPQNNNLVRKKEHSNTIPISKGKRVQAKSKKSKTKPFPSYKLTSEAATKIRRVRRDSDAHFTTDEEVAEYLKSHPSTESMGKFGVPQDKYRWGFYGSRSMEYDVWGRCDKGK